MHTYKQREVREMAQEVNTTVRTWVWIPTTHRN